MEFYISMIYERASELYVRAREKIKNLRLTMEMQSIEGRCNSILFEEKEKR